MERLKKAMERARTEGQTKTETTETGGGRHGALGRRPRADAKQALRIRYTETATVDADSASLRNDRILLSEDLDPATDAYKVLRTQILQKMRARGLRTLAITSPSAGDGKTTTAINLAISLARDVNQTVLLVDLDLKRPAVAKYFLREQALGISDYLISNRDLSEIMFNPSVERLVILPGKDQIVSSSEILSSPRFVTLVDELKTRYEDRIILFDMPPLFASDDVIAFLPHVDAVVLVVAHGQVTKSDLERAKELLGDKVIGVALNKASGGTSPAGYY